jgi:hypothetical protein
VVQIEGQGRRDAPGRVATNSLDTNDGPPQIAVESIFVEYNANSDGDELRRTTPSAGEKALADPPYPAPQFRRAQIQIINLYRLHQRA